MPADRQSEEDQILAKIKQGETAEHFETIRQTKSGQLIHMSVTVSPIRVADGLVIGYSSVARDISENKAAEKKIRQLNLGLERRVMERTAELQAANEDLEAFSYSAAHDLRAPLRAIGGFVNLLESEFANTLSHAGLEYLTVISKSTERMGKLIDDLLAFSRIGRAELNKAEVDLNELVHTVLGDFEKETKDRNIAWEIGSLPKVWADPSLLRLVLVNLFSNAVKFTSTRAKAKIEISCTSSGSEETVISIRDNGVGFDPSQAGRLFGTFQRLHGMEEFEGTGIGLANVQRIILRHGGKISGEGTVDGGARFTFSLPIKA